MNKPKHFDLSSAALHILAMLLMLGDHMWATVVNGQDWLTWLGRIAFPIFSFMLVEGSFHTRSAGKYARRLLIAAIVSEIPFNLAVGGYWLYPFHQNVMWTLLLGLGMIRLNEWAKSKHILLRVASAIASVILGYLAGTLLMVDYGGAGILTILAFYFFRNCKIGQLLALICINFGLLSGYQAQLTLFNFSFMFPRQGMAVLSLIPIWLYRGRQGYRAKWLQFAYYAFYPAHLLILGLLMLG